MSKIILVKRIVSLTLLLVALPLLLMGLIEFTLFDSGFQLIFPALVILAKGVENMKTSMDVYYDLAEAMPIIGLTAPEP